MGTSSLENREKRREMNTGEAQTEAIRRWGYQARAFYDFSDNLHYVQSRYGEWVGTGKSYEEAFANAKNRKDRESPRLAAPPEPNPKTGENRDK